MKKLLTLFAFPALLCLMPLTAWAQNTVSTITTTENITKTSTVYVGEVVVDGETKIKYLYSDDMSLLYNSILYLLDGINGMADGDYATLLEGHEFDYTIQPVPNGFAICSNPDLVAAMDGNWSSAQYVGTLYYPDKTIISEINSNLYDIDQGFRAALDAQAQERIETIDTPANVEKCFVFHIDSKTTTDVYYTIEDGQVVRHLDATVSYDCEATTVIYTKVELASGSASSVLGDVNGDGDVSVNDVAMIVNYILGIIDSNFIIANADINGDGEIDINDVMGTVKNILEGNQEEPKIPSKKLNIFVGQQKEDDYPLDYGSGLLQVNSSNPTVATGEIDEEHNQLILTGISEGQTLITISDMDNTKILKIDVTVSLLCPDDNHPHMVDLGLPSGTKWACCNVDDDPSKQSPTNYGSQYAWGETEEKSLYNEVTYLYAHGVDEDGDGYYDGDRFDTFEHPFSGENLISNIAGTNYDVAHVKWGISWVMPSYTQQRELLDKCTSIWAILNGVYGRLFTGPSSGTIFLPASGFSWDDNLYDGAESVGHYWSSSLDQEPSLCFSKILFFSSNRFGSTYNHREIGCSVRPVFR